ncbi:MAG: terpene cyclase/mutase family protein [Spirochaetales bacterium]|nr:terpene cyclase/mutase family protein [Spirochaetales bacterium]
MIETWKQLRFLAEKYELDKRHGCVAKAAEYIFSCQTGDGDIRGFLGNQYAAYYTGAVLSLLVKAGYEDDPRVDKAFRWLLSSRQNDGGWIGSPMIHPPWKEQIKSMTTKSETVKTWDRTKPLCVNSTGMILRAFASHPAYRKREEAVQAAKTLKKYFFWRTTIPRTATRTTGCVFNSLTGGIT